MYSRKQIDKLAERAGPPQRRPPAPDPAPSEPIPEALWQSLLDDPRAASKPTVPIQQCRLADIQRHMLRVECSRCSRIVEMQKAEAIRYFGADAIWKNVAKRLLDQTCTNRTGRHEEDGCWPQFDRRT